MKRLVTSLSILLAVHAKENDGRFSIGCWFDFTFSVMQIVAFTFLPLLTFIYLNIEETLVGKELGRRFLSGVLMFILFVLVCVPILFIRRQLIIEAMKILPNVDDEYSRKIRSRIFYISVLGVFVFIGWALLVYSE